MRERVEPELLNALRRRGITPRPEDGDRHLPPLIAQAGAHREAVYQAMHRYSFRLVLRDILRLGAQGAFSASQLCRHAGLKAVQEHLQTLTRAGLVHQDGADAFRLEGAVIPPGPQHRPSLGPTLEWYVAELLQRELGFITARGVPLRGGATGGDLDVVAMAEGQLVLLEVKSGPPKHQDVSQVAAFLDRVAAVAPDGAIFLEDTELRMADKIVVLFEQALSERNSARRPLRLSRGLYSVGPGLYIANAHASLQVSLAACVAHLFRRRGTQLFLDLAGSPR